MHNNIKNKTYRAQQHGFTLIELMIAIPLGLLVMLAVLKIFTANVQGVNLQNSYARVQENGRMSMQLMSRDIRIADYWGCFNNISAISNNLNTADGNYNASLVPSGQQGVTGNNDVSLMTIDNVEVVDTTDTLTLWSAKAIFNAKMERPYMATTSSEVTISTGNNIALGDMLVISDCEKADLFSNSSATTEVDGSIGHATNSTGNDNVDNSISEFSDFYDGTAQLLTPYVKTYFIGVNTSGGSSLYRSDNGIASELVRGVTDLQFMYGEDTSGNGSVDTFSDAAAVTNMDNVTSIRLQLISANGSELSTSSLTRTYTVTTNIRNRTLQ